MRAQGDGEAETQACEQSAGEGCLRTDSGAVGARAAAPSYILKLYFAPTKSRVEGLFCNPLVRPRPSRGSCLQTARASKSTHATQCSHAKHTGSQKLANTHTPKKFDKLNDQINTLAR
jgi:hypothetical protein